MHRTPLLTLLLAALLVPAPAHAGDSLLSGYGGPGGGEQVVLGSKLLPPGGGGKGGLRRSGATPPAISRSAPLPADGAAAGLTRLAATPASAGSGSRNPASRRSSSRSPEPTLRVGGPLTSRPVSTSGDAGSPLGRGDILLVLLGAATLAATAAGTRRLVGTTDRLQT